MPSSIPALTHPSAPPPTWRIALNLLDQNPYQPRSQMDEGALAELIASIRDHGLLQPITVRKVGMRYQVIAGHRRLEAFRRLLAEAEHDEPTAERFRTIPAHQKFDVTDEGMALFALVENLQRDDLSPLDAAQGVSGTPRSFGRLPSPVTDKVTDSTPQSIRSPETRMPAPSRIQAQIRWWSMPGSNRRPPQCHPVPASRFTL